MTTIAEMTPVELRIACAKKCGWKIKLTGDGVPLFTVYKPNGKKNACAFYENIYLYLPKYDTDYNALRELILAISENRRDDFIGTLIEILDSDKTWLLTDMLDGEPWEGNIRNE